METDLVEGLKCFIDAIVNENVSLVISRSLLSEVASSLQQIQDGIAKAVAHYTLDAVQPRVISFEDQVGAIRQHLAGKLTTSSVPPELPHHFLAPSSERNLRTHFGLELKILSMLQTQHEGAFKA